MLRRSGRSGGVETVMAAVETSPGSGVFAIDDRLRVEEVNWGVDESIGTARLSVRIDDSFDTAAARARYQSDLRVVVRTDETDAAERVVLFEGYPPVQEARGLSPFVSRLARSSLRGVCEAESAVLRFRQNAKRRPVIVRR